MLRKQNANLDQALNISLYCKTLDFTIMGPWLIHMVKWNKIHSLLEAASSRQFEEVQFLFNFNCHPWMEVALDTNKAD